MTQDDLLFPYMTVGETLTLAARLHGASGGGSGYSHDAVQGRVQEVLQDLGLKHTAATIIGDSKIRGVSGGERKRVSIGVELMHDPKVLFLDEPTSGLSLELGRHPTLARSAPLN